MNIGWYHQVYKTGEWDGFNEAGIETFRNDPLLHLARETIQNSIDARLSNDTPIIVSFRAKNVATKSIPDYDEFYNTVKSCANEKNNKEDEKSADFFDNAKVLLSRENLTVLMVEDCNTTGIRGPCENGTAYHAFMKAKGVSRKESGVAAGSYGIGKLAPYAVSELRTVFVSTIYEEKGKDLVQFTQGKTILTSHKNNESTRSSIGFWGKKEGCLPIEGVPDIASWIINDQLPLKKQGTKLSILGFDAVVGWENILANSVVENFFGAIAQGDLIVKVGNKYELTTDTIEKYFIEGIQELSSGQNYPDHERFECAYEYYKALNISMEDILHSQAIHLKHCKLNLIVSDGLPKKVCMLRNGMVITDTLKGLIRFSDFKDFVAVFQCDSDEGNKLLRKMEPPTHTDFNPVLLSKNEIEKGKKALKEVVKWIREVLNNKARDPISDKTVLDELKDLLGDEEISGSNLKGEEVNPLGKVTYQGKPIKVSSFRGMTPEYDESSGETPDSGSGGGGEGKNGSGGEGGTGLKGDMDNLGAGGGNVGGKSVELRNIRAPIVPGGNRRISFTSTQSGKVALKIFGAGADNDYLVEILDADKGIINNGKIEIDCLAGEKTTILLELYNNFSGAIKVVANEI